MRLILRPLSYDMALPISFIRPVFSTAKKPVPVNRAQPKKKKTDAVVRAALFISKSSQKQVSVIIPLKKKKGNGEFNRYHMPRDALCRPDGRPLLLQLKVLILQTAGIQGDRTGRDPL